MAKVDRIKTANTWKEAERNASYRLGHIAVAGRWNRLPKRLEDDYIVSNKVLGSGLNGSVISAKSRYTGEHVAIKQLCVRGVSPKEKQQLASEVEIFLSMDHPHVARLIGVYEEKHAVSLVMECMTGGELFKRIREKKVFKESEAANATLQMLLAVNYLHHEGITHRDLKLENFLYDEPGSDFLKLIDFGFSKFCRGKKCVELLGTLTYCAPEVLKRNYGERTCDLWSLGCITFILLFGYMPFRAANDGVLARRIVRGAYKRKEDRWKSVSKDAQDFVQKLLVVRPEERLTSKQALAHPFVSLRVNSSISSLDASTARGFLTFTRADEFTKSCLQVMAWCLPLEERRQLRDAFITLGRNADGIVKIEDIEKLFLVDFGIPASQLAPLVKGLRRLDADGDGELHYSDFLAGVMARKLEQGSENEQLLQETFRRFEVEGQGFITQESFEHIVGHSRGTKIVFTQPHLANCGRMTRIEFIRRLYHWEEYSSHEEFTEDDGSVAELQVSRQRFSKRAWLSQYLGRLLPSCLRSKDANRAFMAGA